MLKIIVQGINPPSYLTKPAIKALRLQGGKGDPIFTIKGDDTLIEMQNVPQPKQLVMSQYGSK